MNKEALVIDNFAQMSRYIGDDAAIVNDTLYSQDAFFEDVHFKRSWMTPYQIAYKAMMINISDAIAMNARPKYALLTLAFPKKLAKEDLKDLMRGFSDAAALYGCEIIGGDTIANVKIDISITIISQSKKPLERKNVKEGDLLAFTGELGRSKKELKKLFRGGRCHSQSRFVKPELRQDFVSRAIRLLNGGMDISDGLFEDSRKMTALISRSFRVTHKLSKEEGCSGEEYEMLVSFAPQKLKAVMRRAKQTRTRLTLFGKVVRGSRRPKCKANHF